MNDSVHSDVVFVVIVRELVRYRKQRNVSNAFENHYNWTFLFKNKHMPHTFPNYKSKCNKFISI